MLRPERICADRFVATFVQMGKETESISRSKTSPDGNLMLPKGHGQNSYMQPGIPSIYNLVLYGPCMNLLSGAVTMAQINPTNLLNEGS